VCKRGSSLVINDFAEVAISQEEKAGQEQIAAALEQLRRELRIGSRLVVTSISAQQATVRSLEIPFSEEEKARQVLKFQTEPYLAFPIEEVIVDFYDTGTASPGKMKVLLTAIHKGVVGEHLELLSRAQIDPEVVDGDFMAVASTAVWVDRGLSQGAAIVMDVGDSKTIACYVEDGKLLAMRCIPFGGKELTESNRGQAELDRTVRYFTSQVRGGRFERVVLSGDCATLPGLDGLLSEALSAEVSLLAPSEAIKNASGREIPFHRVGMALGLALRGVGESICLQNFRQEEHAYARPYRRLRKSLATAAALTALTVAFLVFSLFASRNRYQATRSDLNWKIQTKRNQIYLNTEQGRTSPGNIPRKNEEMWKLLDEEASRLKPFSELQGNASVLNMLLDISSRIPKDMKVEISYFHYMKSRAAELPSRSRRRPVQHNQPTSAGTATIKGTVSSDLDATRLKEIVEESPLFTEVQSKGTSKTEGGRVDFTFVLSVRRPRS
jgi:type IV pilus assembly protein PilM